MQLYNYIFPLLLVYVVLSFKTAAAGIRIPAQDTGQARVVQYGIASYYADKFEGRVTANGEVFSQKKLTAAHNTLPLGTRLLVTNLRNNKSVTVRVNDRMHHRNKRLIDLSKAAAKKIGFIKLGITRVSVEVIP